MLIRILHQKLTLGRSVYQRGDVFECPPQEAQMMAAIGLCQPVVGAAKATREPPLPPRGFSTRGPQLSYIPTRARRAGAPVHSKEQGACE